MVPGDAQPSLLKKLKPALPRGRGGVWLQPPPAPWTALVPVSSQVLPGLVLPSHQTSDLLHLEREDRTTLQGSDMNSNPQRVGLWPENARSTGMALQAEGGKLASHTDVPPTKLFRKRH